MISLDKNESYWFLRRELGQALSLVTDDDYSTYPTYDALRDSVARYAGVDSECVLLTPGSDAAIELIARVYNEERGQALLPVPTFYGYEHILDRLRIPIRAVPYTEQNGTFRFPLDKVRAVLAASPRLFFLCHPNNPLGCPLTVEDMEALEAAIPRNKKTIFVSDEAYFEFSDGRSFLPHIATASNVIILRTFSKAFGLAGARLGYVLASPHIIARLQDALLPWPVAHPTVRVAGLLVERADEVHARRAAFIKSRDRWARTLSRIPGITVYASDTNFHLVRVPDAARVYDLCRERSIYIAKGESMSRFPAAKRLLKNTIRMAVPSTRDSVMVYEALERACHAVL